MVLIFEDSRIASIVQSDDAYRNQFNMWQYFKRRFSLKPQLQARILLCSLYSKHRPLPSNDPGIYRRLNKTIQ